ncbi:MAG: hypothetical protein LBK57_00385 [Clostridiales Family XIII bacterium]|nr:hypothetical protein [Clostridiales Family XIII bacterium]
MRNKFLLSLIVTVILSISLSGCGDTARNVALNAAESVVQMLSGKVTGEIGTTYATQWFKFTIISIEEMSEYEGYAAEEGYTLYDVLITETGTFEEASPMGTFDFYMDAPSFEDFVFPLDPISDEMMPLEFDLGPRETVEYHMVYEVPMDSVGLKIMFTEVDEDENEGVTFNIPID